MTNCEKFRTENERIRAFNKVCGPCEKVKCDRVHALECFNSWLSDDAEEEKTLPCPYCGCNSVFIVYDKSAPLSYSVACYCGYSSKRTPDKELTIAAHNRVARAVMAAEESEVK